MNITGNRYRKINESRYGIVKYGKAGEHLVCADLLLKGYDAFMVSDSASPFDIILNYKEYLLKLQVKATSYKRFNSNSNKQIVQKDNPSYFFGVGVCGNERKALYKKTDVDIYCFVALDDKHIAYMVNTGQNGSVSFRVPELKGEYRDEKWINMHPLVTSLRASGLSVAEVAIRLEMSEDMVYRYSAKGGHCFNKKIIKYINEFPIEKCLNGLFENNIE